MFYNFVHIHLLRGISFCADYIRTFYCPEDKEPWPWVCLTMLWVYMDVVWFVCMFTAATFGIAVSFQCITGTTDAVDLFL